MMSINLAVRRTSGRRVNRRRESQSRAWEVRPVADKSLPRPATDAVAGLHRGSLSAAAQVDLFPI